MNIERLKEHGISAQKRSFEENQNPEKSKLLVDMTETENVERHEEQETAYQEGIKHAALLKVFGFSSDLIQFFKDGEGLPYCDALNYLNCSYSLGRSGRGEEVVRELPCHLVGACVLHAFVCAYFYIASSSSLH